MTEIIILCFLVSFWCNGIYIATDDGMALNFIRRWLDRVFIKNNSDDEVVSAIYYPILYCINCMASLHGTLLYFLFNGFGVYVLIELPVVVVSCVWLNGYLYKIYND